MPPHHSRAPRRPQRTFRALIAKASGELSARSRNAMDVVTNRAALAGHNSRLDCTLNFFSRDFGANSRAFLDSCCRCLAAASDDAVRLALGPSPIVRRHLAWTTFSRLSGESSSGRPTIRKLSSDANRWLTAYRTMNVTGRVESTISGSQSTHRVIRQRFCEHVIEATCNPQNLLGENKRLEDDAFLIHQGFSETRCACQNQVPNTHIIHDI